MISCTSKVKIVMFEIHFLNFTRIGKNGKVKFNRSKYLTTYKISKYCSFSLSDKVGVEDMEFGIIPIATYAARAIVVMLCRFWPRRKV